MEYLTHFKLQVHRFDTHTHTMFVVKEICGESVPVSQTSFNSIVNACCIAQHCVCVCPFHAGQDLIKRSLQCSDGGRGGSATSTDAIGPQLSPLLGHFHKPQSSYHHRRE